MVIYMGNRTLWRWRVMLLASRYLLACRALRSVNAHWQVRRVSRNGGIRWHNHWVNVSHVLGEQYIAFEETGDGLWDVHFGPVVLGRFHEPLLRIEDANGKLVRNPNHSRPVLPMSLE